MYDLDKMLGKERIVKSVKDPFNNIFGLKEAKPSVKIDEDVKDMFESKKKKRS
jgi:hypothetical protein